MAKYLVLAAPSFSGTAACGDTWGQRAVTGGGIGAGSGALIGALTPLGVLPGLLVGGAVGARRRRRDDAQTLIGWLRPLYITYPAMPRPCPWAACR